MIWIFEKLFLQLSLGGEEWWISVNGGKRESGLDDNITFEKMEVGVVLGAWNLVGISQDLSGSIT